MLQKISPLICNRGYHPSYVTEDITPYIPQRISPRTYSTENITPYMPLRISFNMSHRGYHPFMPPTISLLSCHMIQGILPYTHSITWILSFSVCITCTTKWQRIQLIMNVYYSAYWAPFQGNPNPYWFVIIYFVWHSTWLYYYNFYSGEVSFSNKCRLNIREHFFIYILVRELHLPHFCALQWQ